MSTPKLPKIAFIVEDDDTSFRYYLSYDQERIVLRHSSDEEMVSFSQRGAEELHTALGGALKTYYKGTKKKR